MDCSLSCGVSCELELDPWLLVSDIFISEKNQILSANDSHIFSLPSSPERKQTLSLIIGADFIDAEDNS